MALRVGRIVRCKGLVAIAVAVGLAWIGTVTSAKASIINFSSPNINGANEVPPNGSLATGSGTYVMDTDANTLSFNITYSGPATLSGGSELFSHIHGPAPVGMNAGVLILLPNGTPKIGVWNFPEGQQANIINGQTYTNIHSPGFPNGEIRDQIVRVPSCGDTVVDAGEECDDGNNVNGDCCDSTCQAETDGNVCDDGNPNTPVDTCTNGVCGGANSMACYQVKDLKVPAKFVSPASIGVDDQVSTGSVSKCKPKFLCVPTELDGSPITDPSLNYICYQCKGAKPVAAFDITDQFGTIRVQTKKIKFVCDPAQLTPAP